MFYSVWGAVALVMLMVSYYDAVDRRREKQMSDMGLHK